MEKESEIKENLKKAYNNHAHEREKSETQGWKIRVRQEFLELLKKEDRKTILEIGAGHGRDSKFFKDNNLQVIAIDLSDEMIKLCRSKDIEAYQLDFYHVSQLDRKFDAIWALNCLLHVKRTDMNFVLNEINKVLSPSGLFFMGIYGGRDKEGIRENDIYLPKRFFSFYAEETIKKIVLNHFELIRFERIETGRKYDFLSMILRKK